MAETNINEVLDMVGVKNRVVDGKSAFVFDGKQVVWEPGETKVMPKKYAMWFTLLKSLYRFQPGDTAEGIPAKYHYKLAILGTGMDESDLTKAEMANVKELLDVENMPELTRIDPQTGQPMRRVYIDPRSTGAMGQSDVARQRETAATKKVSSAIVQHAAEEIADAAQGASETEIVEAVKSISGRMEAAS